MKDKVNPCHHSLSEDVLYKDVVVVGNGPSGLVTSYMLAGNVPYLKEAPEHLPIDEMLRIRLSNVPEDKSLYDIDLLELAEGLEGRSHNPIPLLMDNLLRPCADIGVATEPLVEWRYDVDKHFEHIVLGRGPPGGSWHTFAPTVSSLSPASWLTLPPDYTPEQERLPAREVAEYFSQFVTKHQLQRYFRNNIIVQSVTTYSGSDKCREPGCVLNARYVVSCFDMTSRRRVQYLCAAVVLCPGSDRPNSLPAPVDRHALYSPRDVDDAQRLLQSIGSTLPVLVVGSGPSSADALRGAASRGLRAGALHRDPAPALKAAAHHHYTSHYAQVYQLMCEGQAPGLPDCVPYPEHIILDVIPHVNDHKPTNHRLDHAITPKTVKLLNVVTNEVTELKVSLIAVLIGSKPDLFFLQTNFNVNDIDISDKCEQCTKEENQRQCFFKNHWTYLKSMVGQGLQSCKSKYMNNDINGNTETTRLSMPDRTAKCTCKNLITKLENGIISTSVSPEKCNCRAIPYSTLYRKKVECQCKEENPFSSGLGFGIDPTKPVDCRYNPIAIDKSTHQVLNAPKGMFALGPLTTDNFIRYIPGGALAIVASLNKDRKNADE